MISLDFSKLGGLVPAVAQDHATGEVLMLGFMNREAWEATLKTGRATYYSRSPGHLLQPQPQNPLGKRGNLRQGPDRKRDSHRLRR